jgi:hypothetical protein
MIEVKNAKVKTIEENSLRILPRSASLHIYGRGTECALASLREALLL